MRRGKLGAPWVNPEVLGFTREVLGLTRARAQAKGPERTKPCMLSDSSGQHANFVSLLSNERPHLVCPLNHVLGGSWILCEFLKISTFKQPGIWVFIKRLKISADLKF
jgi:hypothetical protein